MPGLRTLVRQVRSGDGGEGSPARNSAWRSLPARMFGVDLRSLAAFRIVLGVVVLMDLVGRWSNVPHHYGDGGVLPRERLLDTLGVWRWSLMIVNGSDAFVRLFFIVTALVAIAVIVGYRTRLAVILLWVLVLSIQVRNPYIQNGGDTFLRVLCFWAMFLPLGEAWSLDRRAREDKRPPRPWIASMATAALLLQIAFMYWFTAILKDGREWRADFTALWYSMGAGHLTTSFGAWLHQFPDLLQLLTIATIVVELAVPVLLFLPWWKTQMRLIAAVSIMGLQFGILATMHVGLFPLIGAFAMVAVLPTAFWNHAAALATVVSHRRGAGWKGFPLAWKHAVWAAVPRRSWVFSAVGADPAMRYTHASDSKPASDAINTRQPPSSLPADPAPLGDPANEDRVVRSSLVANLVVSLCLVLVTAWNITTVSAFTLSSEARKATVSVGLHQKWNMFAPRPPRTTQWYLLVGQLEDRQRVNLVPALSRSNPTRYTALSWERPANIGTDYYGDKYWRKYLASIGKNSKETDQRLLAAYACRWWNSHHGADQQLATVQLVSASERILADGEAGDLVVRQFRLFNCI